jgi:hypothetical protein
VGAGQPRRIRRAVPSRPADRLPRFAEEFLEIADDRSDDWRERTKENGETEITLNPVNVTRSRLRFDARRWLLSKTLPKRFGTKPDLTEGVVVIDTLAQLLRAIDGNTRGLPNQPAMPALPAPLQEEEDIDDY